MPHHGRTVSPTKPRLYIARSVANYRNNDLGGALQDQPHHAHHGDGLQLPGRTCLVSQLGQAFFVFPYQFVVFNLAIIFIYPGTNILWHQTVDEIDP